MKAIIIGATGLTGKKLLIHLLNNPLFTEVISASRSSVQLVHPKLREVTVDFDKLESYSEILGGDHYFCCLGTTIKEAGSRENFSRVDLDYPLIFARIAKAHNAKSFSLISAVGANKNSRIFYNQVKGRLESEIQELGLSKIIIYRPGFLLGREEEKRTGEEVLTKLYSLLKKVLGEKKLSAWVTDTNELSEVMNKFPTRSKKEVDVLLPRKIYNMAQSFQVD